MTILEPYIPKEYLALKINYCKQQLAALPEAVMTERTIKGALKEVYSVNRKVYYHDSKAGKEIQQSLLLREQIACEMARLEGLWNSQFRGAPPPDLKPHKIERKLCISENESVIIDSKFFYSLKNDANPFYPEHKTHYFNGTYYRSPAEVEAAKYYTAERIPFKYEPEIWLKGLNHPIYSDFVILIKELDQCKFHEHFGLKNSSDYTRRTATTYINYSNAGLLPGLDVFYTYDLNDVPFDARVLPVKLNSVVYNSLFTLDTPFASL